MSLSKFKFTRPLLTKAVFEMLPTSTEKKPEAKLHLHRNAANFDGKNEALVELTVQINKKGDKINENAAFYSEVAMQSMFSWEENIPDTLVENLLIYNATALLLSYIRPIVTNITSASPISAYHIPFLNLEELFKKEQEKVTANTENKMLEEPIE